MRDQTDRLHVICEVLERLDRRVRRVLVERAGLDGLDHVRAGGVDSRGTLSQISRDAGLIAASYKPERTIRDQCGLGVQRPEGSGIHN
jgi:hypothetical protein